MIADVLATPGASTSEVMVSIQFRTNIYISAAKTLKFIVDIFIDISPLQTRHSSDLIIFMNIF